MLFVVCGTLNKEILLRYMGHLFVSEQVGWIKDCCVRMLLMTSLNFKGPWPLTIGR